MNQGMMYARALSLIGLLAGACGPSTASLIVGVRAEGDTDNPIPPNFVLQDPQLAQNELALRLRMEEDAAGTDDSGPPAAALLPITGVGQRCRNYCGPAAALAVLHYYGLDSGRSDENALNDIAAATGYDKEQKHTCNDGKGTCLQPIRDYLNRRLGEPVAYSDQRPAHDLDSAASTRRAVKAPLFYSAQLPMLNLDTATTALMDWTTNDVGRRLAPLIVLVQPNPQRQEALPGYDLYTGTGHYLTLVGYDRNGVIYYVDSARVNQDRTRAFAVPTRKVARAIWAKAGLGGCHPQFHNVIRRGE